MQSRTDQILIRRLGEVSENGMVTYDLKTRQFVYFNSHFLRLFDLTKKDIGQNPDAIMERIAGEDMPYLQSKYRELLRTGHSGEIEFSVRLRGAAIRHLSCQVLLIGENNLLVAFVKDVTRQKTHDDYAVDFGARKDTLLDMLTHNLGGPLQLSKDILGSMTDGTFENSKDAGRILGILKENTQLCIDIVSDFLRAEHSESIRTVVHKSRFDVIEKIRVTLDKLIEMNRDKTFSLHSPREVVLIHSDAIKFFQVIHNIVSNAIKFTGEGGRIEIFVIENTESITITVKDNGIGIPDSMKEILFTERVASRPGVNGERSAGIGLSIAKKLIEIMGGRIWFESDGHSGSAFSFDLPKE